MGKIYNIVLNSSYGTASPDIRQVNYFYDWNILEQGRYKLTFSFIASQFTTTNTTVCNVFTDLCQTNTFFASNPNSTQYNSLGYQYLGMLRPTFTGTNQYIYSPNNFNGEIYLNQRPQNNLFTIYLLNNDTDKTAYSSGTLPGNYSLVLTLELLEENKYLN